MVRLARVAQHWQLKLLSVVFAIGLWLFVMTGDRGDAVFTVPLDVTDRPARLEVTSLGVETVLVRVQGRRSLLERLREDDFRVAVSLRAAEPGRFVAPLAAVNVVAPPGVKVIRVTPSQVRATLEARQP